MRRITTPSLDRKCQKCGGNIPLLKRADASYCSTTCSNTVEKARYKATHPDYVLRQLKTANTKRHIKEYGHTRFLENPLLNKKDKFRLARSLGFRSMLEYTVALQLTALGVPFKYEPFKIPYKHPANTDYSVDDLE